jgi:hypothetical protein
MSTLTAPAAGTSHRAVLRARGTTVEVHYGDPDDVFLQVTTQASDAAAGAGLLCAAVTQARARRTRQLRTVLDASSPACWTYLEALRTRVGEEVESIALRRAGSSVLVTLHLVPPPASPRPRPGAARTRGHGPDGRPSRTQPRPAGPHPQRRTS